MQLLTESEFVSVNAFIETENRGRIPLRGCNSN